MVLGAARLATPGCDNNWTSWWVGSRTQWNVTKDFYMGLDVAYLKFAGHEYAHWSSRWYRVIPATPTSGELPQIVDDQDIWMARFRVHRDFYP